MSVTPGNARKFRDAVISILQSIQYGGEPAFVQVLDNTVGEFEGYPSVRVLPNNLTSEVDDTRSFRHTVSFAVIMHFPIGAPDAVESDQYDRLLDLTDLIQDQLEHSDHIDQLSTIDPTVADFYMEVPSTTWHVADGANGSLLLCNLTVNISYLKSAS